MHALHGDLAAVGIDLLLHLCRRLCLLLHGGKLLGGHDCHLLGRRRGYGAAFVRALVAIGHIFHGAGVDTLLKREGDGFGQAHDAREFAFFCTILFGADVGSHTVFIRLAVCVLNLFGVAFGHEEFKVREGIVANGIGHRRSDAPLLDAHVDDLTHEAGQR